MGLDVIDEIESTLSAKLCFKTISKDRLSENKFEEKINYLFRKIHSLIKKIIIKYYLKRDKDVIVIDDTIKYVKSFKIIPKGEIDFYYYFKYKIFEEYEHLKDISISFILEHKFGGGRKIIYQIYRDLLYEILTNKEDLIFCYGIHKGKYLYNILTARKHKKGYIISTYNIDKFFPECKNKTLLLTIQKIKNIMDDYFKSKKGLAFVKKYFDKTFIY